MPNPRYVDDDEGLTFEQKENRAAEAAERRRTIDDAEAAEQARRRALSRVDPVYPTVDQIIALNAQVAEADRAVADAHQRQAEVRARRASLDDRLAGERGAEPPTIAELDPALVDALASNPAVECCSDAVAQVATRHASYRADRDQWQTRVDLVRQAIGKVDREAADLVSETAALQAVREQRWEAFLTAAHGYLVAEFQQRFATLRRDLLGPLVDMQRMELPAQPATDDEPAVRARSLVGFGSTRMDRQSAIKFDRSIPDSERPHGRSSNVSTVLFEFPHGIIHNLLPAEAIERFRASLSERATASPRNRR